MAELTPRSRCAVCKHPDRAAIETMLAGGLGVTAIERQMRANGKPIKRETVSAHLKVCMGGIPTAFLPAAAVVMAGGTDFATLVQRRASQLMNDGLLRVSTRDGLAAQQLLDRREEKAEDRKFMLNLARALAGGGRETPTALIESGDTIEGTFEEVDQSLYAPAHLRETV